jgi:Ca2+-binding RTX toxin-like protein
MRLTLHPNDPVTMPIDTVITLDLAAFFTGSSTPPIMGVTFLDAQGNPIDAENRIRAIFGGSSTNLTLIPEAGWETTWDTDPLSLAVSMRLDLLFSDVVIPLATVGGNYTQTFDGTEGNDTLNAAYLDLDAAPPTRINGGAGNDRLGVLSGAGAIYGDDGNDSVSGAGLDDGLFGGSGNDSLYGRAGNDVLNGGEQGGNDRLFGGDGDDYLHGGDGDDALTAGAGNDILLTSLGRDTLRGEAGNDRFDLAAMGATLDLPTNTPTTLAYGGAGEDTFVDGTATLGGGDYTTRGFATLHGGAGNDFFLLTGLEGGAIYGGSEDDSIQATRRLDATGTLTVFGGSGNDVLNTVLDDSELGGNAKGGTGNDTIVVGNGHTGWGETGDDNLAVNTGAQSAVGAVGGILFGGSGSDSLYGGAQSDTLRGGDDADTLYGGNSGDSLMGGNGDDSLWGGTGADMLNGGIGDNALWGGDGTDTFVFDTTEGMSRVADFQGGTDRMAFNAEALGIGDGDTFISSLAIISSPLDAWISSDEVVLLQLGGTIFDTAQVATELSFYLAGETTGQRSLAFVTSGTDTYIYLHTADGEDGVDVASLEHLGIIDYMAVDPLSGLMFV